jgi:hypothetical protein
LKKFQNREVCVFPIEKPSLDSIGHFEESTKLLFGIECVTFVQTEEGNIEI